MKLQLFEEFEKESSCGKIIRFILGYPWVTALHHVIPKSIPFTPRPPPTIHVLENFKVLWGALYTYARAKCLLLARLSSLNWPIPGSQKMTLYVMRHEKLRQNMI